MARFYGKVGYSITQEVEDDPGIWIEEDVIRFYNGDVVTWGSRWDSGDKINNDLSINNQIRIVADPFSYQNFRHIRWVEWMGTKWTVTSVQIDRPRLVLAIGGVYNAQ